MRPALAAIAQAASALSGPTTMSGLAPLVGAKRTTNHLTNLQLSRDPIQNNSESLKDPPTRL
jgi:hypothetical protein